MSHTRPDPLRQGGPRAGGAPRPDWAFHYSGPLDARRQMAIDTSLLDAVAAGRGGPVFRLYTWHPPAVSLGHHQDPAAELDLAAVADHGFDVVMRPTGGRALLHADELTYAVVARADDPAVGGSIAASHAAISAIFQAALAELGVAAELAGHQPTVRPRERAGVAVPCFATATPTELLVGGRKILGSAQRRQGEAFLQHGSLLLGEGHLALADVLRLSAGRRAAWRRAMEAATTTLARERGGVTPLARVIEAVAGAAALALDRPVRFKPTDPSLYSRSE